MVAGQADRCSLWVEVITGMEFPGGSNVPRVLDARTWLERRRRLAESGGTPGPLIVPEARDLVYRALQFPYVPIPGELNRSSEAPHPGGCGAPAC